MNVSCAREWFQKTTYCVWIRVFQKSPDANFKAARWLSILSGDASSMRTDHGTMETQTESIVKF